MWFGRSIKMILIATALFPPEPVVSANLSFDIATSLSIEDEVVVVSPRPTRPSGMIFDKEYRSNYSFRHVVLESYTCPQSSVFGRFKESHSFGKYIKKYIESNHENISVIYANVWPLFAQKVLLKVAYKYKIPVVLHIQDIYPESISKKVKFFGALINQAFLPVDRYNLQKACKVVTISEQMKKYLAQTRLIAENKITVIRNWQNDDAFTVLQAKDNVQEDKEFCFLYLGSINPTAGVDLLIHAFGKANFKKTCLMIAGDGSDKQKCIQIAEGYEKRIEFIQVTPEQVPKIQSMADILLLPLKKGVAGTALPSKMTAYMFSGKPIIASIDMDSEVADIIEHNSCGWVIEPENEQQLIKCMDVALKMNQGDLEMMGERALQYATKNLSKEFNLTKLISIIKDSKREVKSC